MDISPAYMSAHMCVWSLWRSEEGIRFPGTGVTGTVNHSLYGCKDLNQVLLTPEPSLQPLILFVKSCVYVWA